MIDFLISAFFLVVAIALSIVGVVIAAWLQQRNWQHQAKQQHAAEQKALALRAVQELARLIDARLYRQRQFLWKLRSGTSDELAAALNEYRTVLLQWNDNFGRIKTDIYQYFDRWEMLQFEDKIHGEFQKIGETLEQVYGGKISKGPLSKEERRLNRLSLAATQFTFRLLSRVNNNRIGEYGMDRFVSHSNRSNLSTSYLVKRLFGLG